MQTVCPACDARYDVPDPHLAPGKRVRCVRCSALWAPVPPPPEVEARTPPEPQVPDEALPEPTQRPLRPVPLAPPATATRTSRFVWLGWLLTALILLALAVTARQFRPQIEHAWPPSQRLYDLF